MRTRITALAAVVLAVALLLAVPGVALAWTHGQFTATTDACAGCHVAHAAQASKLLKIAAPEAALCFLCHGDGGAGAPYDVENGCTIGTASIPLRRAVLSTSSVT